MNEVITTNHDFKEGDILAIRIEPKLWKLILCWIFRRNIKRSENYTITGAYVSSVTVTKEEVWDQELKEFMRRKIDKGEP